MARSRKLQQWFDEQGGDIGKAQKSFKDLPVALKKELEAEATNDSRVKAFVGLMSHGINEILIRNFLALPGVVGKMYLELPGLRDDTLPSSNWLENTALFGVAPMKRTKGEAQRRPYLREKVIFGRQGSYVQYTGEQLYQFDWDVLHYLIRESKDNFDQWITLTPASILESLGLTKAGKNYQQLLKSLKRLSECSLYVQVSSENFSLEIGDRDFTAGSLHLINEFYWTRTQKKDTLHVKISGSIARLFEGYRYGLVDLNIRKMLRGNDLAKKLQCLISTQKASRQIHTLRKLQNITGLDEKLYTFSWSLSQALNKLLEVKCITAYWVSKPKRGEADERRYVLWKDGEASMDLPIPLEAGTYVCARGSFPTASNNVLPYPPSEEDVEP